MMETNFYNRQVVSAFGLLFEEQGFQFHVTANFNRSTTLNNGRDKLRLWGSRTDRKLFGSRYYKRKIDKRIFFVAVPEIGNSSLNLHFHMLVRIPAIRHDTFIKVAEPIWKQFNPVGSLYVQRIGDSIDDTRRLISYDLKEAWKKRSHENIIFSSEFGM